MRLFENSSDLSVCNPMSRGPWKSMDPSSFDEPPTDARKEHCSLAMERGVTLVAVAPDKFTPGYPKKGFLVRHRVMPLEEALSRTYGTDAHLVAYVVGDNPYPFQPRIKKEGLADFFLPVRLTTFFVDVDNPGHGDWTPELIETARVQWNTLPILRTSGVYHTAHGRRIVQPLAEPILVDRAELYLRRYLFELEAAGLPVDWSCKDWTRHFRLPTVRRNGRPFRTPFMDLSRMRPIEVEPIAWEPPPETVANTWSKSATPPPDPVWTTSLPDLYRPHVEAIARVIRSDVSQRWHDMYLALSGALARRVPVEHVPEMVRAIATAAGSEKPESHTQSARDTVRRYKMRLTCTGFSELQREWPAVAEALAEVTARGFEARARSLASVPVEVMSIAEATAGIETVLRSAPDGLSLVKASCGVGKTRTAVSVAAERSMKKHVSDKALGLRAPTQSKTSISVDKNALAIQVTSDLRAQGIPVRRVFGPLSVVDDEGKPVCRYHEVAEPLVAGGQSIQWEFCQGRGQRKCEHFNKCTARDGEDGPHDARVTVGSHAMIGALNGAAGSTGLLVIDEPPVVLETIFLSPNDINVAIECITAFDYKYASALTPVLHAVRDWSDPSLTFVDITDTIEMPMGLPKCPPIRPEHMHTAKRSFARALQLGAASKVMGTLHRAMTSEVEFAIRLVEHGRDKEKTIVMTAPREALQDALRREGAVVVMDANAELHRPIYTKIVDYEPPIHVFEVADGAPIERTLLRCGSATRKGWMSHGRLVLDTGVVNALRAVFDWASGKLALITFHVLEVALRAALGASVEAEWANLNQTEKGLAEAKAALGPIVQAYKGTIVLGHYGGVRGLNTMADADCLATLGDPWPNLGEVEHDVAFLGLEGGWEPRLEALCRAEIEQSHGRLRTVHRTRPGRALHVGNVLPSGYGWSMGKVTFKNMATGPAPTVSTVSAEELRSIVEKLGGVRATARALGCNHTTVMRYLNGRGVPSATTVELKSLAMRQSGTTCETQAVVPGSLLNTSLSLNDPAPPSAEDVPNPVIGNPAPPAPQPLPRTTTPAASVTAELLAQLGGQALRPPANDELRASGS